VRAQIVTYSATLTGCGRGSPSSCTQPGLPLKKGRCGTYTHDYKRNGTTTLFAALDGLQGKVIGQCHARHRHQEWLKFLRRLDDKYRAELSLHVVMDNYGTRKAPAVQAWLAKHPRFVCHFIPTNSSWLNMVERWFRERTIANITAEKGPNWKMPYVSFCVLDLKAQIISGFSNNPGACEGASPRG